MAALDDKYIVFGAKTECSMGLRESKLASSHSTEVITGVQMPAQGAGAAGVQKVPLMVGTAAAPMDAIFAAVDGLAALLHPPNGITFVTDTQSFACIWAFPRIKMP